MPPHDLFAHQQTFFASQHTKNIVFRLEQLAKLKALLKAHEPELYDAIARDFGKSVYETYQTELALLYHEINVACKRLPAWSKRKRVATNLPNLPGKSYILPEPYGKTLIIGAWNYPYQLTLTPVVSAMAAGNTAIVKPSELSAHCSHIMASLINDNFPAGYLAVVEGGVAETSQLLELPFDKIFFTGSVPVGKIVYQAAARHLTPVTLELGGKSPAFVLPDCDLNVSAKRLVWGKFLNAGQTCVAPDYLLVHASLESALLEALRTHIQHLFPEQETLRENYVRIINQRHFERLVGLIDPNKIFCGGTYNKDRLYIAPTILRNVSFEDKIMQDEIFGPILPVLTFESLDEAIAQVRQQPKPLALYVFSNDAQAVQQIFSHVSFGGGAVNETILHLSNGKLPFGGVGHSGIGAYHEEAGFRAFSHYKSILEKPTWFDPFLKYPPYTPFKMTLLRKALEGF